MIYIEKSKIYDYKGEGLWGLITGFCPHAPIKALVVKQKVGDSNMCKAWIRSDGSVQTWKTLILK